MFQTPARPLSRPRGFTILELLTVIGIILFLMSVVVGVVLNTRVGVQVKSTRALIQQVGIALTRYYAEFKEYPPDTGFGMPIESSVEGDEVRYDSGSLWRYLGQTLVVKKKDGTVVRQISPFTEFSPSQLVQYEDPKYGKSFYVVDNWKRAIGYRGDPKRVIYSPGGVDVFSAGPNGRTASTDEIDNGGTLTGANQAYDGSDSDGDNKIDNATELGDATLDGSLTGFKRDKKPGEELDDINNWDPN